MVFSQHELQEYVAALGQSTPLAGSRLELGPHTLNLFLPSRGVRRPITLHVTARMTSGGPEELVLLAELAGPAWLPETLRSRLFQLWLNRWQAPPWLTWRPVGATGPVLVRIGLEALAASLPFPVCIEAVSIEPQTLRLSLAPASAAGAPAPGAGIGTDAADGGGGLAAEIALPPGSPSDADGGHSLPAPGLYQRVRRRIEESIGRHAPPALRPAIPWLLLTPDLCVMLWGLSRDKRVPLGSKAMLITTLVYVLSPIDLIPDPIPVAGVVDDLALVLLALQHLLSHVSADVVRSYWPGRGDVLEIVQVGVETLSRLLPVRVWDRLRSMLRR